MHPFYFLKNKWSNYNADETISNQTNATQMCFSSSLSKPTVSGEGDWKCFCFTNVSNHFVDLKQTILKKRLRFEATQVHCQSINSLCKQEAMWYRYYQWEWSEILWDPVVKCRQDRGAIYVTMDTFCFVWFISAHVPYTVRDTIEWNFAWKHSRASLNHALITLSVYDALRTAAIYIQTLSPANSPWFFVKIEWHLILHAIHSHLWSDLQSCYWYFFHEHTSIHFCSAFLKQFIVTTSINGFQRGSEKTTTMNQIHQRLYEVE